MSDNDAAFAAALMLLLKKAKLNDSSEYRDLRRVVRPNWPPIGMSHEDYEKALLEEAR